MELGEGFGEGGLDGGGFLGAEVVFVGHGFLGALDGGFGGGFVDVLPLDGHVGEHFHGFLVDGDEAFADGEILFLVAFADDEFAWVEMAVIPRDALVTVIAS